MRFSQRIGIKPVNTKIQIDSMDENLKNSLWSCLTICYWDPCSQRGYEYDSDMKNLILRIWLHYFKEPTDRIPYDLHQILFVLRRFFFEVSWDEVYDFIEFIAQNYEHEETNKTFKDLCNNFLEKELSAFRFVGSEIASITSETEIASIEEAQRDSSLLKPINTHLRRALNLLSDKKTPDFRNSIKESISAVETICRLISGNPKATLGEALKKLKDCNIEIHPALEKGFLALYGYTSDEDGIRHSLLDESKLKFIDAKFMLVSCSTFISLLIEKSNEAKIKL